MNVKEKKYIKTVYMACIVALASVPTILYARTIKEIISESVLDLINPLIFVVSGLAVLFFLWGLAQFILNAGSEDKRNEGKQVMLWGIIALFILFSFWGVVQVLQRSIFGEVLPPPAPFSQPGS